MSDFETVDSEAEYFPLLVLENPPEVVSVMLDDIRAELGAEVVDFLQQARVLGRVVAVLLECKAAGHTPNLLEAACLAGVEQEIGILLRAQHPMTFTIEDLDDIIAHALPAMSEFEAAAIRREAA
ncbi:MAG TPA: hypothetical protein VGG51_13805 [Candidatus Cybelea sp.]